MIIYKYCILFHKKWLLNYWNEKIIDNTEISHCMALWAWSDLALAVDADWSLTYACGKEHNPLASSVAK